MIQFGTGGWRAVIGSDFIERNICLVTEGICALMTGNVNYLFDS